MAGLEEDGGAEVVIDTLFDPSGAAVVSVSGDLDISNAASLQAAVAAVTAQSPERLIFDLSDLRFMDSAGIAVLIGAAGEVSAVQLRGPSPVVRRVIELTGLTGVLPIES
jgi:anti-sigma B factor antagonist